MHRYVEYSSCVIMVMVLSLFMDVTHLHVQGQQVEKPDKTIDLVNFDHDTSFMYNSGTMFCSSCLEEYLEDDDLAIAHQIPSCLGDDKARNKAFICRQDITNLPLCNPLPNFDHGFYNCNAKDNNGSFMLLHKAQCWPSCIDGYTLEWTGQPHPLNCTIKEFTEGYSWGNTSNLPYSCVKTPLDPPESSPVWKLVTGIGVPILLFLFFIVIFCMVRTKNLYTKQVPKPVADDIEMHPVPDGGNYQTRKKENPDEYSTLIDGMGTETELEECNGDVESQEGNDFEVHKPLLEEQGSLTEDETQTETKRDTDVKRPFEIVSSNSKKNVAVVSPMLSPEECKEETGVKTVVTDQTHIKMEHETQTGIPEAIKEDSLFLEDGPFLSDQSSRHLEENTAEKEVYPPYTPHRLTRAGTSQEKANSQYSANSGVLQRTVSESESSVNTSIGGSVTETSSSERHIAWYALNRPRSLSFPEVPSSAALTHTPAATSEGGISGYVQQIDACISNSSSKNNLESACLGNELDLSSLLGEHSERKQQGVTNTYVAKKEKIV